MRFSLLKCAVINTLVFAALLAALEGGCAWLRKIGVRNLRQVWVAGNLDTVLMSSPRSHSLPSTYSKRAVVNPNPSVVGPVNSPQQNFGGRNFYRFLRGVPWPDAGKYEVAATSNLSGKEVYRASYIIGLNGYRKTPQYLPEESHAVFIGDSFIFGTGVDDDETIPSVFARKMPGFHAYNMGFPGYGPNDLVVRTQIEDVRDLVREKRGLVVYLYNFGQVMRLLGQFTYLGTWGADHPYLREMAGGKVEHAGSFRQGAPLWTFFAQATSRTNIMRFFEIDWPLEITKRQAHFFAATVERLRKHYTESLPGSQFLVVIAPRERLFLGRILSELDEFGLKYLDYSEFDLPRYVKGAAMIHEDGHYTAAANEVLADQLAIDLRKTLLSSDAQHDPAIDRH